MDTTTNGNGLGKATKAKRQEKDFMSLGTANRIGEIKAELNEIFKALEGQYNPKFTCDPCPTDRDVYDFLASLQSQIESKSDGRPQPLDLSGPYMKSGLVPKEELENLKTWAKCESSGYREKAILGDRTFNMDSLLALQAWITSVIDWHKANPEKMRRNGQCS